MRRVQPPSFSAFCPLLGALLLLGCSPLSGTAAAAPSTSAGASVAEAKEEAAYVPQGPELPYDGPLFDEAEVLPYFRSGSLADAQTRFAAGRFGEAMAVFTLADDGSPQVAYLRGQAALELGQNELAAGLLDGLGAKLPAIADRVAFALGQAYQRLERFEEAAKAFGAVPESSVLADQARLAEAAALRAIDEPEEALRRLERLRQKPAPAWGNNHAAAALFLAGQLHEELEEPEKAREAWLTLWSEHPLAPQAAEVEKLAKRISQAAPTLTQRVRRARGYFDAQRNREGVEQIEALSKQLRLPDALACEANFLLGRGYRRMREHRKAISILEPVVEKCTDPSLRVRALYVLGSSTSIATPERGIEVYLQLAKEFADHSFADDALVYAADLKQRAGDPDGARALLLRMVDDYPDGDFRADGLFRLFWLDRAAGKAEAGLEFLRRLETDYAFAPDSIDRERALYWQGRTLADLDRKVGAVAAYETLLRDHPASYYSMLARGRLRALDPHLAAEVDSQLPQSELGELTLRIPTRSLLADPHYVSALELLRLGQEKAAVDELLRIDRKAVVERAGGSSEPIVLVAWLLDRANARRPAHQIARTELRSLLRGRPEAEDAMHFRIAYPLAYRELIEKHAKAAKVPPDLLQALMREESSLDPEVVSWAGAVGLTQLMPRTAQAVATRLKLGKVTPTRLREPDLNVRLGSSYLGSMLQRWGGNPALACAAYNAGPGAVSRWLGERGHLELDEFVEEIPIEETRNYVKRVLTSFNAYRLTYGEGDARFLALAPQRARP